MDEDVVCEGAPARFTRELRAQTETAFLRCLATGEPVLVLGIEVYRPERLDAAHTGVLPRVEDAVLEAIAEAAGARPVHAFHEESALIALVPGIPAERVDALCHRVLETARGLAVYGLLDPLRVPLSIGIAHNGHDRELWFGALVAVAREGIAVAHSRCGECSVHTMLYGLMQERARARHTRRRSDAPPLRRPPSRRTRRPTPQTTPTIRRRGRRASARPSAWSWSDACGARCASAWARTS